MPLNLCALLGFIPISTDLFRRLKQKHAIVSNYGGDQKEPWVSPLDIASVIAEEMEKPFDSRTVRYIASDEISPNEIVNILGKAIGNPELRWVTVSDEELLNSMLGAGINSKIATGMVEMQASQRDGSLYEDFYRNMPLFGNTKFTDFAKDFAEVFREQ